MLDFIIQNKISIIASTIMFLLAYLDFKSFKTDNHKDFKSSIVSLGILGTFIGIFIGLYGFDTTSIKDSVPILLEGLKTAFLTSIVGMGLSILLSIVQKYGKNTIIDNEIEVLNSINNKLNDLDRLSSINANLDSIDTNIKSLSKDISSVKEEMKSNQSMLFEFLENSLNKINQSLDEAIDKLAEGATEEIIKALENVIQDFNQNLTEQFGDNFKQLNESVRNLVTWQDNYKNSIEQLESLLNEAVQSIKTTDEKLTNLTANYEKIDTTHNHLKEIIATNDNQIKNIEIHLKKMSEIGEKSQLIVDSIDTFSDRIKDSLSSQSETLTQLIKDSDKLKKEIEKRLPESLDEMNKALTSLTNKFRNDYEVFLNKVSELTNNQNIPF